MRSFLIDTTPKTFYSIPAMFFQYNIPTEQLVASLVNKTVRYFAEKSKIKADGVRVLKIEAVEKVSTSANGKRYVTVKALDVDDSGESKYRNLHLAGIDLVV